ncbi:MAG: Na+/H+ antiporter NhaC [Proteobacteria bacterium]|jgi:Na+:H+ antiporter, NhaC family|nr:Na+/H+ antiporter NhaC [Pseudomonadota bacterium]
MTKPKLPSFSQAFLCFGGIIAIIVMGLIVLEIDMHVLLLICLLWTCGHSYLLGFSFIQIKKAMSVGIEKGLGAFFIFVLIGVVISALLEGGTIASIVYYSLDLIYPAIFLPAGVLLCSFMSLAVGTSWGTVGTAGVILIGVGSAMGIPLPIVAGAIVSGATFGDKLSPVSDTTNLAAVAAETNLYKHIKSMLYTTVPTYIICLILFTFIGFEYADGSLSISQISAFQQAIDTHFVVSFWALLPIIVLFILSIKKIPAEPAMMASVVVAVILAMVQQDRNILDILISMQEGFRKETGHEGLNMLVNRGGIQSMMWTLSLTLFALALGGLLDAAGFLTALLKGILANIRSVLGLIFSTLCTGILACLSMGESYIAIIVTSQLFKKKYEEMGLEKFMLSRTVEESTTLACPIIPWTTAGAFYYGAMGIPVLDYLPYAFLNYLNPLVSLILTYFGFAIFKTAFKPKNNAINN